MRVTRAGIIARHRHTGPVFAHILKGRWHYLEHDWVAEEGGFVFEPPARRTRSWCPRAARRW
jgi:2,4'-dihydroxyacetophenone dioxygenase